MVYPKAFVGVLSFGILSMGVLSLSACSAVLGYDDVGFEQQGGPDDGGSDSGQSGDSMSPADGSTSDHRGDAAGGDGGAEDAGVLDAIADQQADTSDAAPPAEAGPCDSAKCAPHGTCQVSAGAASCVCDPGYHAKGLSCVQNDACSQVKCGWFATCKDGTCSCMAGYEGDATTGCTETSTNLTAARAELVKTAEDELGKCEGTDVRPYMQGQPGFWCYDFVAWVYGQSSYGLGSPLSLPTIPGDKLPKNWHPLPGDLIKFKIQHYGMVRDFKPNGTIVYTVEGNVNSCVMNRSTALTYVEYYGSLHGKL